MTDLIARIREIADRRARYARTVQELRAMPLDVALDLDLYTGDAERIARAAVYGDAGGKSLRQGSCKSLS